MANISYGKRMLRTSISQMSGPEVYNKRRFKEDEFYCYSGLDQEGFEKKFISNYIGYGVFTTRDFHQGDFLLEYVGERIPENEAIKREKKRKSRRSYMYFFKYSEKTYCVDATRTMDRLCHLVNDAPSKSKECNARMKMKIFPNIHVQYPRLCLYALRDIPKGEEIRYDYGDDEENMEWRKKEKTVVCMEEDTDEDPFDLEKDFEQNIDNTHATSNVIMKKCSYMSIGKNCDIPCDSNGTKSENTITSTVLKKCNVSSSDEDPDVEDAEVDNSKSESKNTVATSSVPTECSAICIGENHDIGHDDSDISKSESENTITSTVLKKCNVSSSDEDPDVEDAEVDNSKSESKNTVATSSVPTECSAICIGENHDIGHDDSDISESESENTITSTVLKKCNVSSSDEDPDVEDAEVDNSKSESKNTVATSSVPTECSAICIGENHDIGHDDSDISESESENTITSTVLKKCNVSSSDEDPDVEDAEVDNSKSESKNTVATSSVPTECSAICIGENHDIGHDDSDISESESENTITSTVLKKCNVSSSDEDPDVEDAEVDNSKSESKNTVATSSVPTECSAICIGENHDIGHDDSDISESESGILRNEELTDSGDESYYPDTESSDTEESDHENPVLSKSEERDDKNPVFSGSEQKDDENPVFSGSESDDNLSNIFPMLSEPNKNITFLSTAKNSKGNLSNKVHACIYCEQLFQNIARHLELKHWKEIEVAKILALQKKSKERRKEWEKLVNRGDFCHNMNVLKDGKGLVIPKYRKQKKSAISPKDYVPCEHCMGYYKTNDLWKHQKYCVSKDAKKDGNSHQYVKNGRLMLPVEASIKDLAHKVLVDMHNDEVKLVIESDYRILEMGKRLFEKHGNEPHKFQYIRAKMRELGQFLICCKSVNSNIKCIDDAINCENWDLMIECVQKFGEYNEEDYLYQKPSRALKLGHSLKKCSKYMKSEGLKTHDKQKIDKASSFLQLYEQDWKDQVSSQALTSLETKKYNKPKLLPLTKDVVKLDKYLKEKASALCRDIEKNVDYYSKLAKVCLAQVILFNRKRSGEAERITLKGFIEAEASGSGRPEPVVMETLSEFEKQLCNTHTRVEIKGKRGRRVPVLFTDVMKKSINILIKNRERSNVESDLLFAKPGKSKFPYRGSDCLRTLAKEAEVENTSTFTSTLLRKQLATLVQILNLSETSQDILATFQGHDIRVHRQFYRLPENVLQAAKVSKVLHSLSDGSIGKYKGKDFDEIEFDEKETVLSEEESEADFIDTDKQVIPEIADTGSEKVSDDETDELKLNSDLDQLTFSDARKKKSNKGKQAKEKTTKATKASAVRHQWTRQEKEALTRQFKKNINLGKTPGRLDCVNAIKNETCLSGFHWKKIKFAVKNLISAQKRSIQKLKLH